MRRITIAAVTMILLASVTPAQFSIRTDNGSLQSPNTITVIQGQASQAVVGATQAS